MIAEFQSCKRKLSRAEVWRVPVAGGEETRVFSGSYSSNFDIVERGIYFLGWSAAARATWLQYYDFDTRKVLPVVGIGRPTHMGFSASADARWVLYTQTDREGSDLMLAENFH